MSFWDRIKQVLGGAEPKPKRVAEPYLHELIKRSPKDEQDYEHWKHAEGYEEPLHWIYRQYTSHRFKPDENSLTIDFLDTPSAKGFVLHWKTAPWPHREAMFVFDYLKERVKALGYRTYVSDMRLYNRPEWIETVERHYLKPPPSFMADTFEQSYGNITIELTYRDAEAVQLRFSTLIFKDRNYKKAGDFGELLRRLTIGTDEQ